MVWLAVAPALFTGIGASFLLERLVQPKVLPFRQRPASAVAIHIGLWLLFFAAELVLFRRPWFAVANVLTLLLIVILVSNAKYHFLREPFIFQDFEYFTDTLKHPRLYLPFFGLSKALLAAAGYGLALWAGMTIEPPLTQQMSFVDFFMTLVVLVGSGVFLLWWGAQAKLPVSLQPEKDIWQLGLLASLWRYGAMEQEPCCVSFPYETVRATQKISGELPNLVVVQSESFFDVRQVFSGIKPEILAAFDSLKASASCWGKLEVPAWGANTVRTEFAFLAGLSAEECGVHRFNPYRKLARQSCAYPGWFFT